MGTIHKESAEKDTFRYRRAFSSKNRNIIWRGITSKTTFDVEILWETQHKDEVFSKEKEFVSLYGRVDKKTGTLANLTDGGDGSTMLSESVINETVRKNRANGCFEKCGKFLSERNRTLGSSWKGKKRPLDYFRNTKTYVYSNVGGYFIGVFQTRSEAAKHCKISNLSGISQSIAKSKSFNGFIFFNEYMGDFVETIQHSRNKPVYVFSVSGELLEEFHSSKECCSMLGMRTGAFSTIVNEKRIINNKIYSFSKSVVLSSYTAIRKTMPVGQRKLDCSRCGEIKERKEFTYCKRCNTERSRLIKERKKNEYSRVF